MYKNIIFDLGNVLLEFNPIAHLQKDFSDEVIEELYEIIFKSDEWLMLDRGVLTEAQAIEIFSERRKEYAQQISQVFENWYDMLQAIQLNTELLAQLKDKGYKLYYLSNFHDAAFQEMLRRHKFFEQFDGGVVSYEVKLLKPEAEIYQTLLNKYQLDAKESLFIDDTKANVEGAHSQGIESIWLKEKEMLHNELVSRNIL